MSTRNEDVDRAIAAYRAQLRAAADVADGDLEEIEDHLRSLTDDLRRRGMPAATAVTEAARRLGDPATVAREHLRVRSVFGSRMPRPRAWVTALLFIPLPALFAIQMTRFVGPFNLLTAEAVVGVLLGVALVAGVTWARAVLLGGMAFFAIPGLYTAFEFPAAMSPLAVVWHLVIVGLLLPWRRGEVSGTGLGLAAYVWAYGAAAWALSFSFVRADMTTGTVATAAYVAVAGSALATSGAVLRARWSSFAGVLAGAALAVALYQVLDLSRVFPQHPVFCCVLFGSLGSGALAALAGSVVAWRGASSRLGTLRTLRC